MRKIIWCIIALLILGCLIPQPARAQDDREKEFIEEEKRKELEETKKIEADVLYDYGGWLRSSVYLFDDQDKERTLRVQDVRLWGKALLGDYHKFYVRGKAILVDYNDGDSYAGDDDYWIKPQLDQLFYSVDLIKALYGKDLARIAYPKIRTQIGRQYLSLGSGLVYNRVHEGIKINIYYKGFDTRIIASQTTGRNSDIDKSRPGYKHSERRFYGLQTSYRLLDRHMPYLVALKQVDANDESPEDPAQEYDYNSTYYGLGVKGTIIPRLQYAAEYIKETGKSYATGTTTKEDIKASGGLVSFRYLPEMKYSPIITLRYLFGSGDKDRGSVTNTVNGNQAGTSDTNFLSFGYALAGYVLSPKLSNLNVYNLIASVKPIHGKEYLENTDFGIAIYLYQKDKKAGAISDLSATESKKNVGKEFDFYFNWQVFSDFVITSRNGVFIPGSAYPSNADDKTYFWSLSLGYSF